MVTCKELFQRDEVTERFTHLLSVDGYHVVMHPVLHHIIALSSCCLCYLALVMWEHKVHTAAVDVEMVAKVLASHSGTLAMPSWEAVAPRRRPAHDVLGLCLLPESKVHLIALLAHAVEFARVVYHVIEVSSAQLSVMKLLVILLYIEVNRAVAHVCKAVVKNLLHQLLLLYDMSCSMWFYRWGQHVECLHRLMIAVGVILCYLHWFQLFQTGLLFYLVVALICIVLQMAYVSDIPHIAHLIAQMLKISEQNVERYGWSCMSQMRVAVNCRTANIHTYIWCM